MADSKTMRIWCRLWQNQGHIMNGECYARFKDISGDVQDVADSRTKSIWGRI